MYNIIVVRSSPSEQSLKQNKLQKKLSGQHFTIYICVARKSAGKRRKWYFQGSRFQNFQGKYAP